MDNLLGRPLADDIMVETLCGDQQATVGQLNNYNDLVRRGGAPQSGSDLDLPLPIGPVEYSVGGAFFPATLDLSSENLLTLTPEEISPALRVNDPVKTSTGIGDVFDALASGRSDDLIAVLDDQIRIRKRDLVQMRRLNYVHQTAVQNAVDTVQSKRLDFLELGTDTQVDDLFLAVFLAVLFALFPPEAVFASALNGLMKLGLRRFGAKAAARIIARRTLDIEKEKATLQATLDVFRAFAGKNKRTLARNRGAVASLLGGSVPKSAPGQRSALKEKAAKLKTDIQTLESELSSQQDQEKIYRDLLVEDAIQKIPPGAKKKIEDVFSKATVAAASPLTKLASAAAKNQPSDIPPVETSPSGIPLDIAFKELVQGAYSDAVFSAEDVIAALEDFREACLNQSPGADEIGTLMDVVLFDDPSQSPSAGQSTAAPKSDIQSVLTDAANCYEQFIWILLYGNKLTTPINFEGSFLLPFPLKTAAADKDLLLKYLKARFYQNETALDIALLYEASFKSIIKTIQGTGEGADVGTLDFSAFSDPDKIRALIKKASITLISPSN